MILNNYAIRNSKPIMLVIQCVCVCVGVCGVSVCVSIIIIIIIMLNYDCGQETLVICQTVFVVGMVITYGK